MSPTCIRSQLALLLLSAKMAAPAATQAILNALPQRLQTTCDHLLTRGGYLADPAVLERLAWLRDGKSLKVVLKPKCQATCTTPASGLHNRNGE